MIAGLRRNARIAVSVLIVERAPSLSHGTTAAGAGLQANE
jgi:hypothetical protein